MSDFARAVETGNIFIPPPSLLRDMARAFGNHRLLELEGDSLRIVNASVSVGGVFSVARRTHRLMLQARARGADPNEIDRLAFWLRETGQLHFPRGKDWLFTEDYTRHCNKVPVEGIDHLLNNLHASGTRDTSWFVGSFTNGSYAPADDDTGANIVARATEVTAAFLVTDSRPAWTLNALASAKSLSNSSSQASIVADTGQSATIQGAFLISGSVLASTTDVLLASSKFTGAKSLSATDSLLQQYDFVGASTT